MGLFKSLMKKADTKSAASVSLSFPELRTGSKVEVLTPANTLLFVGRLRVLKGGDILEIRGESGGYLPRGLYNQALKLQIFQADGTTLALRATVAQSSYDFWRVENLQYLQNSEKRSFFRQNIGVDGWVYPLTSSKGQRFPCTVLDISAGGARVRSTKLFQLGATFRLEVSVFPGDLPFSITCAVLRTVVRPQPGSPVKKYEYGCQFVELTPRDQERLTQAVFTLQRKAIQKQRNQAADL